MKTKIVALLLCVFSVVTIISFTGCDLSAKPTKSKVCEIVSGKYDITLPETIELINYSTNVGFDGGIWYCVFSYDYGDEEFNSLMSREKDAEFESKFLGCIRSVENYFNKDYVYPDLTEDYEWIYAYTTSAEGRRGYELLILYFKNKNQLVVIDDTIQLNKENDLDI